MKFYYATVRHRQARIEGRQYFLHVFDLLELAVQQ